MRIKEYFYAEVKEELDQAQRYEENSEKAEAKPSNKEFVRWFFDGIQEQREKEKQARRAKGLCLSLRQYVEIEQGLLDLAERIGLDIESDIQHGTGCIILVFSHFDLHRKEDADMMDALQQAIHSADYLYHGTCQRYGQTLVKLELQYDLDL